MGDAWVITSRDWNETKQKHRPYGSLDGVRGKGNAEKNVLFPGFPAKKAVFFDPLYKGTENAKVSPLPR